MSVKKVNLKSYPGVHKAEVHPRAGNVKKHCEFVLPAHAGIERIRIMRNYLNIVLIATLILLIGCEMDCKVKSNGEYMKVRRCSSSFSSIEFVDMYGDYHNVYPPEVTECYCEYK